MPLEPATNNQTINTNNTSRKHHKYQKSVTSARLRYADLMKI